jgi:tRNA (cytidine32/guanosine34-2'-O)-methyltransferase
MDLKIAKNKKKFFKG